MWHESAVNFDCNGDTLVGILHECATPATTGVILIVGGPQYRVGSHRQFVLLARHLAANGFPCLRFDYRSMGDSSGAFRDFTAVNEDIRAAVDRFCQARPAVQSVVLWGLCDAASAITFYAPQDPRITGMVLLNPWVRTAQGEAQAVVKHYYRLRLFDRQFWRKLFSGHFDVAGSLQSLYANLRGALSSRNSRGTPEPALPQKMLTGIQQFRGNILLILSGKDLTAAEFTDLLGRDEPWQQAMQSPRVTRRDFPEANHTFSSAPWRQTVNEWTLQWLQNR